jgi:hypothetical protein
VPRNLDSFAAAWFRAWRSIGEGSTRAERLAAEHRRRDASDELSVLIWKKPEEAWSLVQALIERAPGDEELGWIGAGPLEDLMTRTEPPLRPEQLLSAAGESEKWRTALRHVWGWNELPVDARSKLLPLLGPELHAYWESRVEQKPKRRWRPPSTRPRADRIT